MTPVAKVTKCNLLLTCVEGRGAAVRSGQLHRTRDPPGRSALQVNDAEWPSHQRGSFEEKQGGLKTARITRQCQGLDMKGATGSRKEDKSRQAPYHKDFSQEGRR